MLKPSVLRDLEIQLLQAITDDVSKVENLNEVMEVVLKQICESTDWDIGEAWLPHPHNGFNQSLLSARYVRKEHAVEISEEKGSQQLYCAKKCLQKVVVDKKPRWNSSVEGDGRMRTGVSFPVVGGNETIAALCFFKREEQNEDPQFLRLVSIVIGLISSTIQKKQATEMLQESEERFRTMADCSPILIGTSDLQGQGIYFNKMWLQFTGRSIQQELGMGWLESFCPEDLPGVWEAYSQAVQNSQSFEVKFRLKRADGVYRWMWAMGAPRFTPSGEFVGLIASCLDITEQKLTADENLKLTNELEQRVKERTRQLEIVNRELESFSYSVSHDLRAPLRAIDGFSQLLNEKYFDNLDERGQQFLSRIRNNTQDMAKLIDDVLQLSRLNRGTLNTEKDINLSVMAHKIIDELKYQEPDRQIVLKVDEDVFCDGDKQLLKLLLQNLLHNAWKYTSKNSLAEIRFGKIIRDNSPVFYVKDNGVGFEMAYADKLFGAFQRMHSAKEFPGTGVGLATVARIVHRHQGQVWAEASVGKGATFFFTLNPFRENSPYES